MGGEERITVVLVEDHDLVRDGLRALLQADPGIEVAGQARDVAEAVRVIGDTKPDVVLLDLRLGEEDGAEVLRRLGGGPDGPRFLILSAHERPGDLRAALDAGARGYLLKRASPELLRQSIRRVREGERVIDQAFVPMLAGLPGEPAHIPELTARERDVLGLVAEGLSNRRVAERLGITPSTTRKHLESLLRKFAAQDRTELVAKAFRRDMLQ